MPVNDPSLQASRAAEPPVAAAPAARVLRAQAVQRLQVGLAGLAAMLLLVGLASVINEQLRRSDPAPVASASVAASPTSDPLADVGVFPQVDTSAPPAKAAPHR